MSRRARILYIVLSLVLLCCHVAMTLLSWNSYSRHREDHPRYVGKDPEIDKVLAKLSSPEEQRKEFWNAVASAAGAVLMIPMLAALFRYRDAPVHSFWFLQMAVVFLLRQLPDENPWWIVLPSIVIVGSLIEILGQVRRPRKEPASTPA